MRRSVTPPTGSDGKPQELNFTENKMIKSNESQTVGIAKPATAPIFANRSKMELRLIAARMPMGNAITSEKMSEEIERTSVFGSTARIRFVTG